MVVCLPKRLGGRYSILERWQCEICGAIVAVSMSKTIRSREKSTGLVSESEDSMPDYNWRIMHNVESARDMLLLRREDTLALRYNCWSRVLLLKVIWYFTTSRVSTDASMQLKERVACYV